MSSFNDFTLQQTTRTVLANMQITEPTPIQAEAIPALLAGSDVVGQAPTGSGKTLAYGIPLVERLSKERVAQALVLVPTRELAVQVNEVLSKLATSKRLTTALLVGGRPYSNQLSALRYGSQIIVGTPGRVKDHLDRGSLVLTQIRICVLDEADQMLDSGFAPAIEEILETTPNTRQMTLFSATMPDWVEKLKKKFLKNPVNVTIAQATGAESTIEQIAYQVPQAQKIVALCTLLQGSEGESSLVFGRTKYGVEKLGKQLNALGFMVGTLHGNKSQSAREAVLTAFRQGRIQTLLATNVAARGLDIKGIYQVINYELPESSELFTHRIGRTGRMGQAGKAITLLAPAEVAKWRRMARSLGQEVIFQHLALNGDAMSPRPAAKPQVVETQEPKRDSEPQTVRDHKQFSPSQERSSSRHTRPMHDSYTTSRMDRRQRERFPSEAPTRWAEGFTMPEREYSEQASGGRGDADRQSRVGRITRRRNASSLPTTEPQRQTFRSKPRGVTPTSGPRRATTSKRFASR
ncbi:MAG: hypothetical protein PVS3B3_25820 [Ktedonobacteraceae bacterium]